MCNVSLYQLPIIVVYVKAFNNQKCKNDGQYITKKHVKLAVQTFKKKYSEEWPCLKVSKRGSMYVYCVNCNCDFSCHHVGHYDCRCQLN